MLLPLKSFLQRRSAHLVAEFNRLWFEWALLLLGLPFVRQLISSVNAEPAFQDPSTGITHIQNDGPSLGPGVSDGILLENFEMPTEQVDEVVQYENSFRDRPFLDNNSLINPPFFSRDLSQVDSHHIQAILDEIRKFTNQNFLLDPKKSPGALTPNNNDFLLPFLPPMLPSELAFVNLLHSNSSGGNAVGPGAALSLLVRSGAVSLDQLGSIQSLRFSGQELNDWQNLDTVTPDGLPAFMSVSSLMEFGASTIINYDGNVSLPIPSLEVVALDQDNKQVGLTLVVNVEVNQVAGQDFQRIEVRDVDAPLILSSGGASAGDLSVGGVAMLVGNYNVLEWAILTITVNALAGAAGTDQGFTGQTLTGNGLDNFIVGDINSFLWTIAAGAGGSLAAAAGVNQTAGSARLIFGNDMLLGVGGNDILVGDVNTLSWRITATQRDSIASGVAADRTNIVVASTQVVLGSDRLLGGDGNDTLVGDVTAFLWSISTTARNGVAAGAAVSQYNTGAGSIFIGFGDDILDGGNANDTLVGDVSIFRWEVAAAAGTSVAAVAGVSLENQGLGVTTLEFGQDRLIGGNGDDIVIGDIVSFHWNIVAAERSSLASGAGGSFDNMGGGSASVLFGDDGLEGNNGNDQLIGDVNHFQWLITTLARNAVAGAAGASEKNIAAGSQTITFGSDILRGNNGNDQLIGDVKSFQWVITAAAGTSVATGAGASLNGAGLGATELSLGDDRLFGGQGNDLIIGDVSLFSWQIMASAPSSIAVGAGGSLFDRGQGKLELLFGQDSLTAEAGNDVLIGDVGTFFLSANASANNSVVSLAGAGNTNSTGQVTLAFGRDQLKGQAGDDNLWGDVQILQVPQGTNGQTVAYSTSGDMFINGMSVNAGIVSGNLNSAVSGNGQVNMLFAQDQFFISIAVDEGTDTIHDFRKLSGSFTNGQATVEVEKDVLLLSLNEEDNNQSLNFETLSLVNISNEGAGGDLILDFASGSSVILKGQGSQQTYTTLNDLSEDGFHLGLEGGSGDDFLFANQGDNTLIGGRGQEMILIALRTSAGL